MRFELLLSKSGLPTIRDLENGQVIHSLYDPHKEAERIYQTYLELYKANSSLVIWGVGLGYALQIILEKGPYPKKIFLFEPEKEISENPDVKKKFNIYKKNFKIVP